MSLPGKILRAATSQMLASDRAAQMVLAELARRGFLLYRDFGDHRLAFNGAESMGRRVFRTGHFHRGISEAVFATAAHLRPGGALVEVGANIGTQTIYAHLSGAFTRIVAVEPDPGNFCMLAANLDLNTARGAVELHQVALSDRDGRAMLQVNPYNSGTSTLEAAGPDAGGVEEVDVRRGARFLDEIGLAPADISLIWMDVERHEGAALEGLGPALSPKPPIYFEYSFDQPGETRIRQIDTHVLSAYPYLYIEEGRLRPTTRAELLDQTGARGGHVNVLACDSSDAPEIFAAALTGAGT